MTSFKKNIHKARNVRIELLNTWIETYDPRYKPPKYYFFMKTMLEHGYQVKLYQAGVSKYVFIIFPDFPCERCSPEDWSKWKKKNGRARR